MLDLDLTLSPLARRLLETHLRQIHRFEPDPELPVAESLDLTWTPPT